MNDDTVHDEGGTGLFDPPKRLRYEPPTFTDVAAERQHCKERLAAAFRLFGKFGFGEGVAGHITVRDPEFPDRFWLNPFGLDFSLITVSDLVCVDHDGTIVHGEYAINQAAFAIHSQVHAARPDVVAAAHTHSVHGKAFSALGLTLDPLTQDSCAFYDDHVLFDDCTGVVLDTQEGKRIAHALGDHKAAILRNHGLLTVGHSVDEAAWWFITMERTCQAQLLAMAAGEPILIEPEAAELTARQVGGHFAGWFSFQPLFHRIVKEQPDLLD
jgi:ribulose-5-phosphate 4-epimerase/fuculose-1-phosphate aldolase